MRTVDPESAPLSLHEAAMLQRRAWGWIYERIGADFGVTKSRVWQVLTQARKELGVDTISEAVDEAVRRGLISPE